MLPNGRKVQCGICPDFEDWCTARDELDATKVSYELAEFY